MLSRRIATTTTLLLTLSSLVALPVIAAEDAWTGQVSASLTAQTGTNDSFSGTLDATGKRIYERDVLGVRANGSYGTTRSRPDGQNNVTQNSQALFGSWKHTLHERFFWDTRSEVSRDSVQDREARAALNTGPGYRFWQGEVVEKKHLDLSAGVGYRFELYNVTSAPVPDRDNYDSDHFADIVVAFDYKNLFFDDRIEYSHTGSAKMPANDVEAYILTTEVILGVPLSESWSLRASFLAEYQNVQPRFVQNTTTRTTLGLGYKF